MVQSIKKSHEDQAWTTLGNNLPVFGYRYGINCIVTCAFKTYLAILFGNCLCSATVASGEDGPPITEEEKQNAQNNPAVNVTVDDPSTIPWGNPGGEEDVESPSDRNVWPAR